MMDCFLLVLFVHLATAVWYFIRWFKSVHVHSYPQHGEGVWPGNCPRRCVLAVAAEGHLMSCQYPLAQVLVATPVNIWNDR